MTKQTIIRQTLNIINQLPADKAAEISDFASFLFKRYEEQSLTNGIHKLVAQGHSLDFLNHDEELYSLKDLKETF